MRLEILNGFRVRWMASDIDVPPRSAEVLTYLAIRDRPVRRSVICDALWPHQSERRALANLRSAVYRLHLRAPAPLVLTPGDNLALAPELVVDLREGIAVARNLVTVPVIPEDIAAIVRLLRGDLLPDWEQDWIEPEREHFRHLRLRALDALSSRLTKAGRHPEAVEVAQVALMAEPLSETAERALIQAYVVEGNDALAVREFELFRRRLWRDLRVRPSADIDQIMAGARGSR
jgi:DNA-binding SARP family transcriptional activator